MPTELNAADEATVAPLRESLRAAAKARALRYPDAEVTPPTSVLPDLAARQGKLLGFNLVTGAPEPVPIPTSFSEILLGSDATGDIYYRAASGETARLPIGTAGKTLIVVAGIPGWVDASSQVETLTNKTLGTGTKVTLAANATGDMYYRAADGTLTRIAPGTNGHVLTLTAGLPTWAAAAAGGGLTNFTDGVSTASPNATVPVASLSATNAATNVDAALIPKGTGALVAQVPDSTTTGGNKRGAGAVDWQRSRFAAEQVASGEGAVIPGGANNAAAGDYSTAGGSCSTARGIRGADAYSAGLINEVGDAQRVTYTLCATNFDSTPTALTAGGGSPTAANTIVLPNNSSYSFTGQVVARSSDGETAAWRISGTIRRGANAASTALVGTPSKSDTNATTGASAWDITIDADTSNGALRIRGTGAESTSICWSARVETAEVIG